MGKKQPRADPPMRIFVFCDGTGQNASQNDEPTQDTNVQRFRQCVPETEFFKHIYRSGVGTNAPDDAKPMSFSKMSDKLYEVTGGGE